MKPRLATSLRPIGRVLAAVLLLAASDSAGAATGPGQYLRNTDDWFAGTEAQQIAANIRAHQSDVGGWPKNVDTTWKLQSEQQASPPTFDNGATTDELRFLARSYRAAKDERDRKTFDKGLEYILKAQYPNGGWPQRFPPGGGYARHITFNDNAMVRLMQLAREIRTLPMYDFVDEPRRAAAGQAFDRGVQCILKCQVKVDGKLTAWCAQHDENDFRPRPARSYELVSLSGSESVEIVRLLMSLDSPSDEVVRAIEGAVAWFKDARLQGIRQIEEPDEKSPTGKNKIVVKDAAAPPLWARFYEIGTNRPIFVDRDGAAKYDLSLIGYERRNGYGWYSDRPRRLLEEDYPAWKKKCGETSRDGATSEPIAVQARGALAFDSLPCERVPLGEPDDYKPCIALLPDGELWLTCFHQHKRDGNKVLEQTLLFRSKDGGRTWTGPDKLDLLGREPYLTMLRDGTIFITGHLLATDVRNPWGYTTGFVHRSADRGRTWSTTRVESEDVKPKAANHTSRNVLELSDGTLLLGVDYDGGGGPYFVWRSGDRGATWERNRPCQPGDFKSVYGFFGGETWLWQAQSGKVWAFVRVDSNELPIAGRPIAAGNDQSDHFILFSSSDEGRTFDRDRDFGDYGEMYMSLLRLGDKRLLLTYTVRDLKPPLGVRALLGKETLDGFAFDFAKDRLVLDAKTPAGQAQGGGFGPTVQLTDGALVTSYSYRGADNMTHVEVVRWNLPR
ncbi:MAG: pectate lyase [Planctomycetia bacterium]|nr:pectate lyase [Planctomycetia bacterium]